MKRLKKIILIKEKNTKVLIFFLNYNVLTDKHDKELS
jgi:hypothetical protein